jgi:hypothetical protein
MPARVSCRPLNAMSKYLQHEANIGPNRFHQNRTVS